jgi:hypothetical protein
VAIVSETPAGDEQREDDAPVMVTISLDTGEAFIETADGERVVLWVD